MVAWQSGPLERVYPVLLIDAIVVKVRGSQVADRPVYVAIGEAAVLLLEPTGQQNPG